MWQPQPDGVIELEPTLVETSVALTFDEIAVWTCTEATVCRRNTARFGKRLGPYRAWTTLRPSIIDRSKLLLHAEALQKIASTVLTVAESTR